MALAAGLSLGLTFYSYIPARALWLLLPLLTGYWQLTKARGRPGVNQLLVTLLLAGLSSWPLWRYLQLNPNAEARLGQLSAPLQAAGQGDFSPLWQNLRGSLALFSFVGDGAWRYNLAGRAPGLAPRPACSFIWACCWLSGFSGDETIAMAPETLLALAMLAIGLAPAAITGPELANTQAIGLLPILYLFPALALASGTRLAKPAMASQHNLAALANQRRLPGIGPQQQPGLLWRLGQPAGSTPTIRRRPWSPCSTNWMRPGNHRRRHLHR